MKKAFLYVILSASIIGSQNCFSQANEKFINPVFGNHTFIFNPGMNMQEIQVLIDTIFVKQARREFSSDRYAFLFMPGHYDLDIRLGYYMTVAGLGLSPDDVVIQGAVRSNTEHHNSVLTNFWRSVENLTIIPDNSVSVWGVSQAAPMRRVHIIGNLQLFDKGYASGGFMADSKIDGLVTSGPQQQWFSRNSEWGEWKGGNWNMMFMGVHGAPQENWPHGPFTTIGQTPVIREKPYIVYDGKSYSVKVPILKSNSQGISWEKVSKEKNIPLSRFYVANAATDNSETLNNALKKGKNLLFTPGIYKLNESIRVEKKGTILIGIGMPSLAPQRGKAALEINDVDGITVSGLLFDAGVVFSESLFVMGDKNPVKSHKSDPSFLFDIFFRVGGPWEGSVKSCLVINSNDVVIDHTWLWRADHGNGVGWTKNKAANGLIVNGNDVTIYGLFNEHFQEYQTLWNGNNGRVYFYQSEMPYDPPTREAWAHDGINGYASYKVSDNVKTHEAWGLGIYNVFYNAPVVVDNAIETPAYLEEKIHNKIIFWLNGNKESIVKSIINGKGGSISFSNRKAVMK
jgi:hypothetical protein